MRTYYHSPAAFREAFSQHFEHVRTLGLLMFIPPPNFTRGSKLTAMMGGLDDFVAELPVFRSIGDHYTIILRRKP